MNPEFVTTTTTAYFDLDLLEPQGRTRRVRFTAIDCQRVCRLLNNLAGYTTNGPVNADRLRIFLAGRDFELYPIILAPMLRHDDPKMTEEKAAQLLSDYVGQGGRLDLIAEVIRDCALASGVWEVDPQRARQNADGSSRAS